MKVKSLIEWYGKDLATAARAENAPVNMLTRYPSGWDFATAFHAATPVVAEFSTTTGWPSRSLSFSASNRLTKSGLPPAGVPVTILMVRVGHCCAASGEGSAAASRVARRQRDKVRGIIAGGHLSR